MSAKTGENVNLIFETLTRAILSSSLKNCPYCKELIPKELIFCQYCRPKINLDVGFFRFSHIL